MNRTIASLVSVGALAAATSAFGQVGTISFSLSGLEEVPPNASPATGFVDLTVDFTSGAWTLNGSYSGMLANVVASHIHGSAPAGVNAPVLFNLNNTSGTSGSLTGAGVFTPAQIADLLAGLFYVNVHTQVFPGGEIRGQAVPAPAALALVGVAGLVATRRRR